MSSCFTTNGNDHISVAWSSNGHVMAMQRPRNGHATAEQQPEMHTQAMQNYLRAQLDSLDLVAGPGLDIGQVKDSICKNVQDAIDATRSELKQFGLTNKSCSK